MLFFRGLFAAELLALVGVVFGQVRAEAALPIRWGSTDEVDTIVRPRLENVQNVPLHHRIYWDS